jgi:hypothetical protein
MRAVATIAVVLAVAAASATASRPAGLASPAVDCSSQVGTAEEPLPEAIVVLERVGLPRGRYPWPLARRRGGRFRLWGKWGMLVRAGTAEAVTVSVARPWRRHARIGWGADGGAEVTFLPCESTEPWIAYAGGFELRKRGCVPFDVRAGDRVERIRIGFGARC